MDNEINGTEYGLEQFSQEPAGDLANKYLTFFVGEQIFSLPIRDVIEIVQMQNITPMPELPYYTKGIINMRGRVIPVIDVNLRFGKPEQPYTGRTCIIILDINDAQVGFIVDAVAEVLDIPPERISPPPAFADRISNYVTGIGKCGESGSKIVLLLNSRLLASDEDLSLFDSISM